MIAAVQRHRWLVLVLLIATAVRLWTVRFGLPALNDPDELMFEMGALRMLRGPTLNPGWFGHPATTTMYVLALVNVGMFLFVMLTGQFTSVRAFADAIYADPTWIILPGRVAMVAFGVATIWLTWRLATRLFDTRVAIFAASLLAVDPVHVTWSQIIRSDMMACVFMLLCLLAACDIAERGMKRDFGRVAVWLGLGIATKWPFAMTGVVVPFATWQAVSTGLLRPRRAVLGAVATGIGAIGILLIASPYLLIDHTTVIENLRGEGQVYHLGANGGSVAYNLYWYVTRPFYAAFGALGLALVAVGFWGLARSWPRYRLACLILVPPAATFVLLFAVQRLVWERWALPVIPLFTIIAALGYTKLVDAARVRSHRRMWEGLLIVALIVPLALRCWSDGRARMTDTRQLASVWARGHIPPGSTVLVEHFAFDILGQPWRFLFPMGDAGCVDARAMLHGKTGYATIDKARAGRSNVDYGTVAPARRASCKADFAILTQAARYRQESDHFPEQDAAYRALIARSATVAVFKPRPGQIGGPDITVIRTP